MATFALRAALTAGLTLSLFAGAQAEDLRLDVLKAGTASDPVELRNVEVIGSNLSRDDLSKLFAPATSDAERLALAAKFQASRVAVAEMLLGDPAKGPVKLRGFRMENIAGGKLARAGFEGVEAGPMIGGEPGTLRSGPLVVEELDLSSVLRGLVSRSMDGVAPKATRMSWRNLDLQMPDKDTSPSAVGGNLVKLSMALVESTSTYDGDVFRQGKLRLDNLVLEFPRASEEGRALADLGYERLDMSATSSASYDAKTRVVNLEDLTLAGAGMGSVTLRGEIGNLDLAQLAAAPQLQALMFMNAQFISIGMDVKNSGVLEKLLVSVANEQGKKPEELRQEMSTTVTQLTPIFMGGDPASLQVAGALGAFIRDPKSLTVGIRAKGAPIPFASMMGGNPMGLLQLVAITASANGEKPR